jgi:hypothetical protein
LLLYSVIILIVYIFIYAFKLLSKDKSHYLAKFIFASIIIIPFWCVLIYQNIFFIIDKNDNNWLPLNQKMIIKNNSSHVVKYRMFLQNSNSLWNYYYPVEFSFTNYKCFLPLLEQKPYSANTIYVKTLKNKKILLQRILSQKKYDFLIFDIPDTTLFIYNDDTAFKNYSLSVDKNKEFVFITTNFTALIVSFLHLFRRPKKKFMSILTIFFSIFFILLSILFLINFIYLIII